MVRKVLACCFSYYRVWQTSGNEFYGSKTYSDFDCGNIKIFFFRNSDVVKNTIFWRKPILPVEQNFGHFFLVLSSKMNLGEQHISVHKVF